MRVSGERTNAAIEEPERAWCTLKLPIAQSMAMSKLPISSSGATPATEGMSRSSRPRIRVSRAAAKRDEAIGGVGAGAGAGVGA